MAIKTSQIIYDVKEILNQFSDDNLYSDRHILYLYNLKRAKYLRQLYDDKSRKFDNLCVQSLCLSLEEVDKGLCGIITDCTVLRSKQTLPTLLPVRNRETLISVTSPVMLAKSFKIVDYFQTDSILNRPYGGNSIYATFDSEGYLYLVSKIPEHKLITSVYVSGIFNDPSDLEDYKNSCECETIQESCFTIDSDYPAPAYIIDLAREEIIKSLLIKEQIKPDTENDSSDN